MNINNFVDMSSEELNQLNVVVSVELCVRALVQSKTGIYPLEPMQMAERDALLGDDKVRAVKQYKERVGCGIVEAKAIADAYLQVTEELAL